MTMKNEREIINGLKGRDTSALRDFLEQYQDRIYNTALSLVKDEKDAEELAQDVFLTVWNSIAGFKEESALSTWVYRITVSKSLDLIRSRRRKKSFAFLTSLTTDRNEVRYHPVNWVHPGILHENKEKAAYLFQAIDRLPEHQKVAFTLSKLEQLSQKEIAEVMQIGEGAVESLLQRAKQNLRKYLEDIYDEIK
jgi:RNA polymerase sigma-70 factor (ECF subfamily)